MHKTTTKQNKQHTKNKKPKHPQKKEHTKNQTKKRKIKKTKKTTKNNKKKHKKKKTKTNKKTQTKTPKTRTQSARLFRSSPNSWSFTTPNGGSDRRAQNLVQTHWFGVHIDLAHAPQSGRRDFLGKIRLPVRRRHVSPQHSHATFTIPQYLFYSGMRSVSEKNQDLEPGVHRSSPARFRHRSMRPILTQIPASTA